ncbi:hypothetical protein NH340_JMT08777 [Sarcoptes scabiei]|nr:hypothetical protein NH340_JMT08777 [Sarcoptes scabiei]
MLMYRMVDVTIMSIEISFPLVLLHEFFIPLLYFLFSFEYSIRKKIINRNISLQFLYEKSKNNIIHIRMGDKFPIKVRFCAIHHNCDPSNFQDHRNFNNRRQIEIKQIRLKNNQNEIS